MNCPSRTDNLFDNPEWNQNPPPLNADLTTLQDFNGNVNDKERRGGESAHSVSVLDARDGALSGDGNGDTVRAPGFASLGPGPAPILGKQVPVSGQDLNANSQSETSNYGQTEELNAGGSGNPWIPKPPNFVRRALQVIRKFGQFVGPGFLVAVAYIDPGNYATDVAAGAQTKFALLFIILMSNLFAIFLQTLCIKLGSVTGLDLAENCKAHLPKWLTIILYIFAEAAIIATDIAEVGYKNLSTF